MLERLQKKWKVKGVQLTLILITFAVGGSVTGYVGRKLMPVFSINQKWLWIIVYIIVIAILWPVAVLLVSVLTGQFPFFIKYIRKIGARMRIVRSAEPGVRSLGKDPIESGKSSIHDAVLPTPDSRLPTRIAIFASGAGSNAQKIIDYFKNDKRIKVALIVCNNPEAGVLKIAAKENIPALLIDKEKFFRGNGYVDELKQRNIDFIVLAGFLWKLPKVLVRTYSNLIINIHPALLPNYGGKGMYGNHVHAAVIAAGEKESGITIHYVDELYDNGDSILQVRCPVLAGDTPDSLAKRIHALEHEHYPKVIEEIVGKLMRQAIG